MVRVERCLFGNGKELHFKKLMDFDTIGGKSNKNGARFDPDAMYVNWRLDFLKCKLSSKIRKIVLVMHGNH